MGVRLNFLNVILVILFVIGIIISAFLLYNLPDSLLKETPVIDIRDIPAILPVLSKVNMAAGATLFVGLAAIIGLLFSGKSGEAHTVFVHSEKEQKGNTKESEETIELSDNDLDTKAYERLFSGKQAIEALSTDTLTLLCKQLEASQGALYFAKKAKEKRILEMKGSYAYVLPDSGSVSYEFGEGLVGQAAKTGKVAHIKDVPEGYIEIFSGLGHSKPGELLIIPLKNDKEVVAVAEIATFKPFDKRDVRLAEKVFTLFGANLSKSKPSKATEKEDKIS